MVPLTGTIAKCGGVMGARRRAVVLLLPAALVTAMLLAVLGPLSPSTGSSAPPSSAAPVKRQLTAAARFSAGGAAPGLLGPQRLNSQRPPDVIVMMTDDQRAGTEMGMPWTWEYFSSHGVHYPRAQVPTNLCCPARSSFLTGRYSHSTGVWNNQAPDGGWVAFRKYKRKTITVALQNIGYETVLLGKLINGFTARSETRGRHRPPGWDRMEMFDRVSYWGRVQGQTAGYSTDALARGAVEAIETAPADQPLFLYVAPAAPHHPYKPGPYRGAATEQSLRRMERGSGFPAAQPTEEQVAGFPTWLRDAPPQNPEKMSRVFHQQADTLMGVDAAMREIVTAQSMRRDLSNTLIIYLSDNGMGLGDYGRLYTKRYPHALVNRIPLLVKYPDSAGVTGTDNRLVAGIDLTSVISELTGAGFPTQGVSPLAEPRDGMPLEAIPYAGSKAARFAGHPGYCGWLADDGVQYVLYADGTEELYDYGTDPGNMTNVADSPAWATRKAQLRATAVQGCRGNHPAIDVAAAVRRADARAADQLQQMRSGRFNARAGASRRTPRAGGR